MKNKEVLIETRKLKKFYPIKRKSLFTRKTLSVRAVEDISLKIYKNETFGLVGESGCGKSTLGRVILQLYEPTSGSVLYHGADLHKMNPGYVLKEIARLPLYQSRAINAYQKALRIEKKVDKLKLILSQKNTTMDAVREKKQSIEQQIRVNTKQITDLIEELCALVRKKYLNTNSEQLANQLQQILQKETEIAPVLDFATRFELPHKELTPSLKRILSLKKENKVLEHKVLEVEEHSYLKRKIKHLEFMAKESKKEASRQLREASRTCGDFILEKEIKKVSFLMRQEELIKREITNIQKNIQNDLGEERDHLKGKLAQLNRDLAKTQADLEALHGSSILQITERVADPSYLKKLENNKEEAINLQKLNKYEIRKLRNRLQMIFQDPYSSLDPRMTVGQAISEAVVEHHMFKRGSKELEEYVIDVMKSCGLDHYMIHRYPHQFSGGQRQRIVIARALALKPEFVVCDESVSALDVSIQSQILNLLEDLKQKQGLTYLFISHDLSVIKHVSDRIAVMYLGDIVEMSKTEELYQDPFHPYSKALISSIPTISTKRKKIILEGDIPSNIVPPTGCKFRTRCPMAKEICKIDAPLLREVVEGRFVSCHFYEETKNL